MKFSIITPVYNHNEERKEKAIRAIGSISSQNISSDNYEHIIVDQSDDNLKLDFEDLGDCNHNIKIIKQPHVERLYAIREALNNCSGEWICFLDSDDIYLPHYLKEVSEMIENNPEYKMFNFGNIYIDKESHIRVRDEFRPNALEVGHEIFSSGTIVNGTFVFHRSLWEEMGDFPTTTDKLWNCWDFSIAAQEEFPELKAFFMVDVVDEPNKVAKELGNPWGQDFYLFYKYTRKYHSLPFRKHLYAVYSK
jgi:glycosyltransferase involved in cell wall biosynthesis